MLEGIERPLFRAAVALSAAIAAVSGCAHQAKGSSRLGEARQLELIDTLPAFAASLRESVKDFPDGPMLAWQAYEREHSALLDAAGAREEDPGDHQLRKLCVGPEAVLSLLDGFEAKAPRELERLSADLSSKLGGVPRMAVAFAALRSERSFFRGLEDGKPLLVVNARKPELSRPEARQVLFARELFGQLHREREPDSASLSPLARRLFREGAALLAVRQLVPRAEEHLLLGVSEGSLPQLRARQALAAKELLAVLDSGRESESGRFFDPEVKDPLIPSGAGLYLADRLFQRLAGELGSALRPLKLSSAEFVPSARRHLLEMASGR
ncbi:MAG: hypothetical protein HYZ28_19385 [Myxococcales bacterium]|nr:hypothetical protein [Myxococcales bacterium]